VDLGNLGKTRINLNTILCKSQPCRANGAPYTFNGMKIQEQIPLAQYTTFGIGGPAHWFAEVTSEVELLEALAFVKERGLRHFVLGGGSNLLIADGGYDGLVIHIALKGIAQKYESGNQIILSAAAGEEWETLVSCAVAANLAGVECLAGIPGTVGGSPVQNIGAYGQEVAETVHTVRAYDLECAEFVEIPAAACGFAYRRSIFNSVARGRYIVTRVDYELTRGGAPAIRYADLRKVFSPNVQPSLAEVAETVRRIRQSKGMLLVDGDSDCRSAGSFFKNPIVSEEQYLRLVQSHGEEIPHYPAGSGQMKLAAAWLIEQAGFRRGLRQGRAAVSSRHTLALINTGGATAAEVLALAEKIASGVNDRFGVELALEPVLLNPQSC
jgi:UDP-N-acetylmuramate dehydrogenase